MKLPFQRYMIQLCLESIIFLYTTGAHFLWAGFKDRKPEVPHVSRMSTKNFLSPQDLNIRKPSRLQVLHEMPTGFLIWPFVHGLVVNVRI